MGIISYFAFSLQQVSNISKTRSDQKLLHGRLGHIRSEQSYIINTLADAFNGVKIQSSVYDTCMKAKITKIIGQKSMINISNPGDHVHVDLFGPA